MAFFVAYQVEGYKNMLTLSCRPVVFTSCKAFLKNWKRSETRFPFSLSAWFLNRSIYLDIFYQKTKYLCAFAFASWGVW